MNLNDVEEFAEQEIHEWFLPSKHLLQITYKIEAK